MERFQEALPPVFPAHFQHDGPYYAVVFTSRRTDVDDGYAETARRMLDLAARQPGFLGVESVHEGPMGITVSYWRDAEAILGWKRQGEHLKAQRRGRVDWYADYRTRICRVEREYGLADSDPRPSPPSPSPKSDL
jgi:heme-degrading monooxygenase HmoA